MLDEGGLYPHHNLYYIVSDAWDMRVLGDLLLSKVAEAFVEAYAVKARGGTLRFQAQYLRNFECLILQKCGRKIVSRWPGPSRWETFVPRRWAALRAYGLDELPD